jgi:hypothetical protein
MRGYNTRDFVRVLETAMRLNMLNYAAAAMGIAAPALGQLTYEYAPPSTLPKESTWVEWLIGAIFILGCMVVAFKGTKRSKLE